MWGFPFLNHSNINGVIFISTFYILNTNIFDFTLNWTVCMIAEKVQ